MTSTDPIVARLKAVRLGRGLTLQQIGEQLGRSSPQTVWQWEAGVHQPRLGNVREWANALGYDLALVPRQERT